MVTLASLIVLQTLSLGAWAIVASTSVASTGFVLFSSPRTLAARPWNVLMGHIMGLTAGLTAIPLAQIAAVPQALPYALAVGLSVLLMQLARAKHPPAAGTALTVPAAFYHGGFGVEMAAVIMLTVLGLLLLQLPVKKHLADDE
jgi:CBS-domain-containing membrane protein